MVLESGAHGATHAGAPLVVTEDLIKSFNISVVVRGSLSETSGFVEHDAQRYEVPSAKDMFTCAPTPSFPSSPQCPCTARAFFRRACGRAEAHFLA